MIYMSRLGIWGDGTPFRTFEEFLHAIEKRWVPFPARDGLAGTIGALLLTHWGLMSAVLAPPPGLNSSSNQRDLKRPISPSVCPVLPITLGVGAPPGHLPRLGPS